MLKKYELILGSIIGLFVVFVALNIYSNKNDKIIGYAQIQGTDVAPMPIVQDSDPIKVSNENSAPNPERGKEFRKFLSASLKINVTGASGSGTIVFYDKKTKYAYVMSCGHLWSGSRTSEQLKINPKTCKVTTWYHNDTKLSSPKSYTADILFWSNDRGYDVSLLRFKPGDWIPNYFPIAPLNFPIKKGEIFNSCGCDGGSEVARYKVRMREYRGLDLITDLNSPRPGRSGGGLMNDNLYLGVCWGTSDVRSGNGIGYFTPLKSIYKKMNENGYQWLLKIQPSKGRLLPIFDPDNPDQSYPKNYLPIPK